ncbi:hypothetical protein [Flavobacterium phycosphaerae]|uniref:hypothetical protein n=1 Tax=Flavobacterium phycosphaerae TaxID=2697515 RepID=UPI00138ADC7D|nr:hypothetical protein [Flavobacterium phycosphaerae]
MKTIKLALFILAFIQNTVAQSKRDLLDEIERYQKSLVENKPYNAERPQVYEAMNVSGAQEYQKVLRESESRGFCEWYSESDTYKETLTYEIVNDKRPFRVNFTIKKEHRVKNLDGTYSPWQTSYDMSKKYTFKLQYEIYVALFGQIKLPDDLQAKIDKFNELQTKDRKRILQGRDY